MMTKGKQEIFYLTDDIISIYSENNVLTEYHDFNLKIKEWNEPYESGVYDKNIFGSIYRGSCNCGRMKVPGGRTCPVCRSRLLDDASAARRYARIELPVYYCNQLRLPKLIQFLKSVFNIKYNFITNQFDSRKGLNEKILNICQFEYDSESNTLLVTDEITDFSKCSYEGLIDIFNIHKNALLPVYRAYINSYVIVVPLTVRAPKITYQNGKREIHNDELSSIYINILYLSQKYYKETFPSLTTEYAKAIFNGSFRLLISKNLSNISSLLLPSKQNYSRLMQGTRIGDSLRATIIPSPDLKIDEVGVPRHLIYETCKSEFVEYLADHLNISEKEAEKVWKNEANSDTVQKLFTKYIDGDPETGDKGKYVIINRAPTLYELGMMCCKVKLTNDYAMRLPVALCEPFNADFDGDAMSAYAVPKTMTDEIVSVMSPKNLMFYKKNHKPLFLPKHEILKGIILGTRVSMPEEVQTFYSLDEANDYRKKHRNFRLQTAFFYNGKLTTLGRERFSKYFGTDINEYLNGIEKNLDGKSIIPLYIKLSEFEDRTDRIQKIQEFASQISTISGSTALTLDDMYSSFDSEKLKLIKEVESDNSLTKEEKDIKIRDLYEQYTDEMLNKVDDKVRLMISDSSRAKLNQLLDMISVRLNVNPDKSYNVSDSTIALGMSPEDYINLAIENRATQDIKISSVPDSGYTTRQFIYLAFGYYYSDSTDIDNPGILLEKREAIGRTALDGTIIQKNDSKDKIKVRSIITSTLKDKYAVTKDMIPNMFKYKEGARIGMSMISSLTEQLTQSGLALKHGGNLFNLDPLAKIIAPENCTINVTGAFIMLYGESGKIYKYPKGENFVLNVSSDAKYKKGDMIGRSYHLSTPAYRLSSIIALCKARPARSPKQFMKNKVLISDCYCTKEGPIKYVINSVTNKVQVFIGDEFYVYNPNACYYYPEGTVIKKYQRFCTGVMDMQILSERLNDYVELFYYYKTQFDELMEVSPELVELVYSTLVKQQGGKIVTNSVIQSIMDSKSFYTSLSFGYAKKIFRKIGVKGLAFEDDVLTRVLLSLITNDQIK